MKQEFRNKCVSNENKVKAQRLELVGQNNQHFPYGNNPSPWAQPVLVNVQ